MPSSSSRPCSVHGCSKRAQTRRLCKAHGGGVRCRARDCKKLAQTRGLCVAHGGGRRCSYEGCPKLGQYSGFCLSHGGGRRCCVSSCEKFVQMRGYCKTHAKQFLQAPNASNRDPATVDSPVSSPQKLSVDFLLNPEDKLVESEDFPLALPTPFFSSIKRSTSACNTISQYLYSSPIDDST